MKRAKRIFGIEKFRGLLLASTFAAAANYVVGMVDPIIVGNLLGSDAFAGVNLAIPLLGFSQFLALLVSGGVGTCYSLSMGRCDARRAAEYFSQGLWVVLISGAALSMLIFALADWFVGFYHPSAEVAAFFRDYLRWISPLPLLQGVVVLLVTMNYADGDSKLALFANTVLLVGSIGLSVLFVRLGYGAAGCAAGTVLAEVLTLMALCGHFFRRSNTLRLVRHFSFRDTFEICRASFGDAAAALCTSLLLLFLNAFAVRQFGSEVLPLVGVMAVLWGILNFSDGIGNAIQPIVTVYYGEGNYPSVREVMHSASRWCLIEGAFFFIMFVFFPQLIVHFLGFRDPVQTAAAIRMIRLAALPFSVISFAGLFNSYYMFIEKPILAAAVTFLSYLVVPVACAAVCSLQGIEWMCAGASAGSIAGLLMAFAIVYPLAGNNDFPLLLPKLQKGIIRVFNLRLRDDEISEVSTAIGAVPGVPMRAALMVEEVFEVVKEYNPDRTILAEVTLDLTEGVKLILRDDGRIFDITDADQHISSLRSFLVASMMEHHHRKMNLVTTGFNRNVFKF